MKTLLLQSKIKSYGNSIKNSILTLTNWSGPYNGVPPFDKVKIEDFIPSLEMAMNQKREEINAITANPEKPNFKNTIEALEKTGLALKRFQGVYYVWTSNMATPALDSIQATVEPRFASFNDSIIQNSQLFARIEAIQNDTASLTAEEKRLWWRYHTTFVLAGAKMDAKSKERVAAINQQLASLFTKFSQNQLKDEGEKYLEIKDANQKTKLDLGSSIIQDLPLNHF